MRTTLKFAGSWGAMPFRLAHSSMGRRRGEVQPTPEAGEEEEEDHAHMCVCRRVRRAGTAVVSDVVCKAGKSGEGLSEFVVGELAAGVVFFV